MKKLTASLFGMTFLLGAGQGFAQTPAQPAKPAPAAKAAAPAAAGAPPAPMAMPKPAPELEQHFKKLEGTWKCEGKLPAGAMGPGSPETPYKSTIRVKKDLGGFWYAGEYEMKKTKTTPGGKGRFYLGYDAMSRQVLSVGVDGMGGMTTAAGSFDGDNMNLVGDGLMMGQKVKTRQSTTWANPKQFVYKFEMDMGKGFTPTGEETCKK